jgi:hypothetical protein
MSTNLVDIADYFSQHPFSCGCFQCENRRNFQLLDDIEKYYCTQTVDQIVHDLSIFTDEQRSLAWSPEPPHEPTWGHDCRWGGSAGLDFNRETRHAKWAQARFRFRREEKQAARR